MTLRPIELLRAAWGASLLLAPARVLSDVHHLRIDRKSLLIARVLGVRHLTQASLSGVDPSPEVLAMGIWVDLAHSLTAVGLAVADRSRARAGLTDALIAAVWAAFGYRDLDTAPATPPRHDRRRDVLARWVLSCVPGGRALLHQAVVDREDLS